MGGRAAVAEHMLTTDEVAVMFRVSPATVKRWARRYPVQLGAVKLGWQWRWPESKANAALVEGLRDEEVGV